MIAITCKTIPSFRSKSIGPLLGEIYMAKVKTPHKRHIGQERVKLVTKRLADHWRDNQRKWRGGCVGQYTPSPPHLPLQLCCPLNPSISISLANVTSAGSNVATATTSAAATATTSTTLVRGRGKTFFLFISPLLLSLFAPRSLLRSLLGLLLSRMPLLLLLLLLLLALPPPRR
jgi:hypothetical protein